MNNATVVHSLLGLPGAALTLALALAACGGGGGGGGGGSAGSPATPGPITLEQRSGAAATTAQSATNACAPIQPFHWQVGDKTGSLASGSVPAGVATRPTRAPH